MYTIYTRIFLVNIDRVLFVNRFLSLAWVMMITAFFFYSRELRTLHTEKIVDFYSTLLKSLINYWKSLDITLKATTRL